MPRRCYWIYLLLFFLNAISYTNRVNMSVAGHSIAADFYLSPVPLGCGVVVIIVVGWFGDFLLSPDALRSGKRRKFVILCLVLTAAGIGIPFANSSGLVVFLTILPISFSNAAAATNVALTSDLLHAPADACRAASAF